MVGTIKKNEKKIKYYSLTNILKREAQYNLIIGERSNGKTYAILMYGLKEYFNHGGQIAILRRFKEDIIGRRASDIWSAINANNEVEKLSNGRFTGIYYYSGKFYACTYDDNGKPVYNTDDCVGYTFSLSDSEHNKSISYPKITTIFFDEFFVVSKIFPDRILQSERARSMNDSDISVTVNSCAI